MEEKDYAEISRKSAMQIGRVETTFSRYLMSDINWNDRLIGIKGARGVGKTTLLLQHIRRSFQSLDSVLYVSMDSLWFETHSLQDLVEYHYTHGGTHIFMDEIHYLPHWQTVVKNLYDDYPNLYIVYTGSCMLQIAAREGDLSRRQRVYTLHGLSFREFLLLEGVHAGSAITLEDVLQKHQSIAMDICGKQQILPLFAQYLEHGYYPFYLQQESGFDSRLQSVVRQVIEGDLPMTEYTSFATIQKVKKMMQILAERVPYIPKMAELYRELDTTRDSGLKMLHWLERADLIALYTSEPKSMRALGKPDKIYLENTNLMYALTPHIDRGTLRETFFHNQLKQTQEVLLPKHGDFEVNRTYIFEVGGKNKTFEQIKDLPNSFLAVDDIEIGIRNRIPLWMFGMMY